MKQAAQDRQSPPAQEKLIAQAAQELGRTLVPPGYTFDGVSAFDKTSILRAWQRLLTDAAALPAARRPAFVIVAHGDRAFRNLSAFSTITEALQALGMTWRAAEDPHQDPNAFINEIKMVVAQQESRTTSRRVRAGQAEARAKGQTTHRPKYGYRVDPAHPAHRRSTPSTSEGAPRAAGDCRRVIGQGRMEAGTDRD